MSGPFRGGLAVLSGPSGSGKSTICKALLADPRCELSISGTTRAPRQGEQDGREYWFHSVEEFRRLESAGEFVESAQVYGNLYGTPRRPLEAASRRSDKLMLLDIDVQGAAQLRKLGIAATYLFIAPPSLDELRRRLIERQSDSPAVVARRLDEAAHEMKQKHLYDHVLINHRLDQTIAACRDLLGL